MNLELKKIKIGISSRETINYAADLYIDGFPAATVFNDGGGGMTFIHPIKGKKELLMEGEAYAKSLPPVKDEDMELNMTLEFWCDLRAGEHEALKQKERHQKKAILVGIPSGSEYTMHQLRFSIADLLKTDTGKNSLSTMITKIQASLKPGEEILNTNLGVLVPQGSRTSQQSEVHSSQS